MLVIVKKETKSMEHWFYETDYLERQPLLVEGQYVLGEWLVGVILIGIEHVLRQVLVEQHAIHVHVIQ